MSEKFYEPLSSFQLVIGLDFERLDKHLERAKSPISEHVRLNLTLLSHMAPHPYLSLLIDSARHDVLCKWKRCQHHGRRQWELYLMSIHNENIDLESEL